MVSQLARQGGKRQGLTPASLVAINRAYGNWQFFGRYRDALLQTAVELIQLFPPGASAKNGADIKLCLDATEDISRFAHIGTVIIIGGDSDFMPVAQKVALTIQSAGQLSITSQPCACSACEQSSENCNTLISTDSGSEGSRHPSAALQINASRVNAWHINA